MGLDQQAVPIRRARAGRIVREARLEEAGAVRGARLGCTSRREQVVDLCREEEPEKERVLGLRIWCARWERRT